MLLFRAIGLGFRVQGHSVLKKSPCFGTVRLGFRVSAIVACVKEECCVTSGGWCYYVALRTPTKDHITLRYLYRGQ